MFDSVMSGIMSDGESETQEEVNYDALVVMDQQELIRLVSDFDVSKYEIDAHVESIDMSDFLFWTKLFKEIIRVYKLNSLKYYAYDLHDPVQSYSVYNLLMFLKVTHKEIVLSGVISRDELIDVYKKNDAPSYLLFALDTMDAISFNSFKRIITDGI